MTIGSNLYEKVKTFKYLGSLLTNENSIPEKIKCRLKAGNSCYYSVQTLLASWLLFKNLKIKIYKAIILPVVLYWLRNMTPLREERKLRYLKIESWGEYLDPKWDENRDLARLHNEKLQVLYRSSNLVRVIKCKRLRWRGYVPEWKKAGVVSKL